MKNLLVIAGPTATGKTELAVAVAKRFDGELVSADSRQVYRGMDIGTGKDLPLDRRILRELTLPAGDRLFSIPVYALSGVPLWLTDVVDPDEPFDAASYAQLAQTAIADIRSRGKLPVLVGGTGFYLHAVVYGYDTLSVPPDPARRAVLGAMPLEQLQQTYRESDPEGWEKMNRSDRNNPRRLVRRIELAETPYVARPQRFLHDRVLGIRLACPRNVLYGRIDRRVDERMSAGMLRELQRLLDRGYRFSLPSMSGFGYREWQSVVNNHAVDTQSGRIPSCVVRWKNDEHAYARRQETWLNREEWLTAFDITGPDYPRNAMDMVGIWYTG